MTWHPNDLVADADLLAYEANILSQFGKTDWLDKRAKALEDWVLPILRAQGYDPDQLRTRFEPTTVWGFTGSAYTDFSTASADITTDDLNLATIFTTVGTDILYVGYTKAFRGLPIRMLDSVSSTAAVLTVSYWGDGWTALAITDKTQHTAGKAFSGGGAITWRTPSDWAQRKVSTSAALYWVKVTISATPTSAKASQIGVIRRSALCAPATFRTLALIFREAPTTQGPGPWSDKASFYEAEATTALQRALPLIGSEMDLDATDEVSTDEADNTAEEAGAGVFRLERG